jgi:hypothetical protein
MSTLHDVEDILKNNEKNYALSYHTSDIHITLEGLGDNVIKEISYLSTKLVKNANDMHSTKFVSVNSYTNLLSRVNTIINLYNSKCVTPSDHITLDNIATCKVDTIIQFNDQDAHIKISDIISRLTSLNLAYKSTTNVTHLEIKIPSKSIDIQIYKEPIDVPKTVFIYVQSLTLSEYTSQISCAANLMGILPKTLSQVMANGYILLVL